MTFISTAKDKRAANGNKKHNRDSAFFKKADELHSSFNKRPRYNTKTRKGESSPAFSHGNASPAFSHGKASPKYDVSGSDQRTPGGGVKRDLRRTVFIYGIPANMTPEQVQKECKAQGGEIKGFYMEDAEEGPSRPYALSVMAKKLLLSEADVKKAGLKTAFIVMGSQGQATKLVKGHGRGSPRDKFSCIHKYDYMKSIRKSPSTRSAGGFTPRFSPKPKVPGSAPLGPQRHRPFSNRSNSYDRRNDSRLPSSQNASPKIGVFRELRPNMRNPTGRYSNPKWTRPRSAPGPRPFPRMKRDSDNMAGLRLMPSTISESSRFTGSTRIGTFSRRMSGGHRDRMAKGPQTQHERSAKGGRVSIPGFNWSRAGQRTPVAKISEDEEWGAVENIHGRASMIELPSSIRQDSSPISKVFDQQEEEVIPEWQVVSDPESDNEFSLQMSNRSQSAVGAASLVSSMNDSGDDKDLGFKCKDNMWSAPLSSTAKKSVSKP